MASAYLRPEDLSQIHSREVEETAIKPTGSYTTNPLKVAMVNRAELAERNREIEYRAECLRKLSGPNAPADLVASLVRHYQRAMGRGVRASRLLGRKMTLALFGDILSA